MKSIVLFLTLMLVPPAAAEQLPADGSLEGFVIRIGIADPVPRAEVVLTSERGPSITLSTTTDGGGRYRFESVPAGTYRLRVARQGFVAAEFGQRGPTSPGTPITVGPGQELEDVLIQLTPTGAIAGRVYDRYDDPVVRGRVEALRYMFQDGRRVLTVVESAETNDLGEYRLFWMQPGQYVVRAMPTSSSGLKGSALATRATALLGDMMVVRGNSGGSAYRLSAGMPGTPTGDPDSDETYVPVYYPGSTDPATAAPIDLRPGANYTGVDLLVTETRTVSVRGRVINGATGGSSGISVTLLPRQSIVGGPQKGLQATVSETGEFEVRRVVPGSYDLVASLGSQTFVSVSASGQTSVKEVMIFRSLTPRRETGRLPADSPASRLRGVVRIDVGNADVENITVALQAGVDITGRVSIDQGPLAEGDPDAGRIRVLLRPVPLIPQLTPVPPRTDPAGTFTVAGVIPFEYRVQVTGLGKNHYVRSVRLGEADVLNSLLRLDGPPRGAMEVVIGTDPGTLDAIVRDDRQNLVPGVRVVLVPDRARRLRSDLFRAATADADGRIHMEGIPPGDYTLFAWEEVEEGAWQDPNFLSIYEPLGRAVRIGANGRESVELGLIPYR